MNYLRQKIGSSRSIEAAQRPQSDLLPTPHPRSDDTKALSFPRTGVGRSASEPLPLGDAPAAQIAAPRVPSTRAIRESLLSWVSEMKAAFAGADRASGRASRLHVLTSRLEAAYKSGASKPEIKNLTWKFIKAAYAVAKDTGGAERLELFHRCADLHEKAVDYGAISCERIKIQFADSRYYSRVLPESSLMAEVTYVLSHHELQKATGLEIDIQKFPGCNHLKPDQLNPAALFRAIKFYRWHRQFDGLRGLQASKAIQDAFAMTNYSLEEMLKANPLKRTDLTANEWADADVTTLEARDTKALDERLYSGPFEKHVRKVIEEAALSDMFNQSVEKLPDGYKRIADLKLISSIGGFLGSTR